MSSSLSTPVLETNCHAHMQCLEVRFDGQDDGGECRVGNGYVHLKLDLAPEGPYLKVTQVQIPEHLGGGTVGCDFPTDLPLMIYLSELKFSRMPEYNARRVEMNISYIVDISHDDDENLFNESLADDRDKTYHVYLHFTLSEYQDVFECVKLDLIYFEILDWQNRNDCITYINQMEFRPYPGDRLNKPRNRLEIDEKARHDRTVNDFLRITQARKYESSIPLSSKPQQTPPLLGKEKNRRLALAILRALAAAQPFVDYVGKIVKVGNTIGNHLYKALINHEYRDEQLMKHLMEQKTPLRMIQAVCDSIDSNQSDDYSVRCDKPLAIRLCRRLVHLSTGLTPEEHLHSEPPPKRITGICVVPGIGKNRVSLLDKLREAFEECLASERDNGNDDLVPVAKLTGKPSDVLYIEVKRDESVHWKFGNVLDEPEWLVLDSLFDLDGARSKKPQYTSMSYSGTVTLIEDSKKDAKVGKLKRIAQYKKIAVVRRVMDDIGVEIYQDDGYMKRIPNNVEDFFPDPVLFEQPSRIEMSCSVLLIYELVNKPSTVGDVHDDAEDDDFIAPRGRSSQHQTSSAGKPRVTPSTITRPRGNRITRNSPPPPGALSAMFGPITPKSKSSNSKKR